MNILFLDIDGVLNYCRMPKEDSIKTPGGFISKTRLALLNTLIDETDCKIVISSTWRKYDDHDTTNETLYDAGLKRDTIIGQTPDFGTPYMLRGNEIYAWLKMNASKFKVNTYAIVDDDSDMLLWQANHFVACDNWSGLTHSTTYRIKRVFNGTLYI